MPRSDGTNRREAIIDAAAKIYSWYSPDGKLEPERVADLLVTNVMNGLLPREPARLAIENK